MRYHTNKEGKIVPYKRRKREVQMVFDSDEFESSIFEDIEEAVNEDPADDATDNPILRHHIQALQTMLEHRLHMKVDDVDWDAMTLADVRDLEHEANMILVQQQISSFNKNLHRMKN